MSSEAITQNDLREILSRTVGSIPSEYKKLLWTNPNPTSTFVAQDVNLDLSDYDAVDIECKHWSNDNTTSTTRTEKAEIGTISITSNANGHIAVRDWSVYADRVYFGTGKDLFGTSITNPSNSACVPLKIYGIKYERVQPPVLDAEIEVLATGITLYRIGRIRALHISDATGFTKSSLIPSADRPSADIQGVAIRTTNGNLATSFGRIVVGSNGDVGALYSSVLNGSQTGFSVASSTDHIIGTAIWYVAE